MFRQYVTCFHNIMVHLSVVIYEFMNLAVKHDSTAIYETWAVADKSEDVKRLFFNHFCELNPAVKLSKYGRASGGVAVYNRKKI